MQVSCLKATEKEEEAWIYFPSQLFSPDNDSQLLGLHTVVDAVSTRTYPLGLLWRLVSESSSTWGGLSVSLAWVHSLTFGACFSQHWAGQKYRSINTIKRKRSWWANTSASLPVGGAIPRCVPVSQIATQSPLINIPLNDFPSFPVSPHYSFRMPLEVTS